MTVSYGPWGAYPDWEVNPKLAADVLNQQASVVRAPGWSEDRVLETIGYIFNGGQRPAVEEQPELTCRIVEQFWDFEEDFDLGPMWRAETLRTAALNRLRA